MIRLAPLFLIALIAGCDDVVLPGAPGAAEAPPARVLPAEVRAALQPGVPDSIIIEDGLGCYLISNVVTEPRQGYLVTDAGGAALCYDAEGNRIARPIAPVLPAADPILDAATPAVPPS